MLSARNCWGAQWAPNTRKGWAPGSAGVHTGSRICSAPGLIPIRPNWDQARGQAPRGVHWQRLAPPPSYLFSAL